MEKNYTGERFTDGVVRERFCSNCDRMLPIQNFYEGQYWCKECKNLYQQTEKYKQTHKESQKKWLDKNPNYYAERTQDHYLYIIKSKDGNILYIGSTITHHRIRKHLRGGTQLELYPRDWIEMGVGSIMYINLADFIERHDDDMKYQERFYLERKLIEQLEPLLNETLPSYRDITADRLAELEEVYYNELVEWSEISIKKITSPIDDEVTFNFSDIKFDN